MILEKVTGCRAAKTLAVRPMAIRNKNVFFILLFGVFCGTASAQTVCGSVAENGTLTLTAPVGMVFDNIVFASYGTPTGSCGSYAISSCNATNSVSIVSGVLVGQNSGSIPANNATFGDPCSGTVKSLAVEAHYVSALPLTLISFNGKKTADGNTELTWQTTNEVNTASFLVEKSTDGISFETAGQAKAANRSGTNNYEFIVSGPSSAAIDYYRLKMVDIDGHATYSRIIFVQNGPAVSKGLSVFPNPVKGVLNISGIPAQAQIRLLNLNGKLLSEVTSTGQTLAIDMSTYPAGVYLLQYQTAKGTINRKLIKQ